jgi:hypothetical protein
MGVKSIARAERTVFIGIMPEAGFDDALDFSDHVLACFRGTFRDYTPDYRGFYILLRVRFEEPDQARVTAVLDVFEEALAATAVENNLAVRVGVADGGAWPPPTKADAQKCRVADGGSKLRAGDHRRKVPAWVHAAPVFTLEDLGRVVEEAPEDSSLTRRWAAATSREPAA